MNPLAHWNQTRLNQLNELDDLQHRLRSLVRGSRAGRSEDQGRVAQWIPLVNVSEDARGYVIKAELPQVKKEDVGIALEDGMLIITGERKFNQNSRKDHPLGLANGCFAHSFSVPNDARPARITAVFKKGLLTVHLKRNAKAKPRELTGKVSSAGSLGVGIEEFQ